MKLTACLVFLSCAYLIHSSILTLSSTIPSNITLIPSSAASSASSSTVSSSPASSSDSSPAHSSNSSSTPSLGSTPSTASSSDFDYLKQDKWTGECTVGKSQSPIDIFTTRVKICPFDKEFYYNYTKATISLHPFG
jgi:hypothetical protein